MTIPQSHQGSSTNPLHTSGADLQDLLAQTTNHITTYLGEFDKGPTRRGALTPEHKQQLLAPPSDGPTDPSVLFEDCIRAAQVGPDTMSPKFLAYVPSSNMIESAVGEMMSSVFNRYVSIREHSPGSAAMEDGIVQWMTALFGLPKRAHGILTTGGSMAVLYGVIAARENFVRSGGDLSTGKVYVSDQAHHCVEKACHIAGIPPTALRPVPHNDIFQLEAESVRLTVEQDIAAGYQPFLVIATGGTTNTGTVDCLSGIADVARDHNLWFHVDACYGGFFILTPQGAAELAGIERADSISLDPHKSLFAPWGSGALLMRDIRHLESAMSPPGRGRGVYLRDIELNGPDDLPEYMDLGMELSRNARAMRLWFPLHRFGLDAFRGVIQEKLDLATYLAEQLDLIPNVEPLLTPQLTIVVARLKGDPELNIEFARRLKNLKDFVCSTTVLKGEEVIRFCILQYRTNKQHIDELLGIIRTVAKELEGVKIKKAKFTPYGSYGIVVNGH